MKLPGTPLEFKGLRPTGPYWRAPESHFSFDELRLDQHELGAGSGTIRYRLNGVRIALECRWQAGPLSAVLDLSWRSRGLLKRPGLAASLKVLATSPEQRAEGLPSLRGVSVNPPFDLSLELELPLSFGSAGRFAGMASRASFSAADLRVGVARFADVAVKLGKQAGGPLALKLDSAAEQGVRGDIELRQNPEHSIFILTGRLNTLQPFVTRYHSMIKRVPGLTEETPVTLCLEGRSPTLRGLGQTVSMDVVLPDGR